MLNNSGESEASSVSDEKLSYCFPVCHMSFFLLLLKFCFFIFVYQQLHYVSRCGFLCIYAAWGSLISLDLWITGSYCCFLLSNLEIFWPVFLQIFFSAPFPLCPFLRLHLHLC